MRLASLFRLLLIASIVGCEADPLPPSNDTGVDTGVATDGDVEATCDVSITADRARLTAGSRAFIEVDAPEGAAVSLTVPPNFRRVDGTDRIRIEPEYGTRGSFDLIATATCTNGAIGDATIAIEVEPLLFRALPEWTAGVDGPSEREHPAVILDVGDPDRVLLYGGFAFEPQQYTVVSDLWAYDLVAEQWTVLTSSASPEFAGGRMAPMEDARAVLYYGGSTPNGDQPFSLHQLDYDDGGGSWTELAPTDPPDGASTLGSFLYDAPRSRYLSICGYGYLGIHCDVEQYRVADNTWTYLAPEGEMPSGRYGFFIANDLETDRAIIWSGGQFSFNGSVNPATDTWALELGEDPVRWVKLLDDGPPGRRNGCSALDPIGHRFFVWGGTPDAMTTSPGLWVLDLDRGEEAWTQVMPDGFAPARSSCTAVYDPVRERILFGFGNTTGAIFADWQVLEL